MRRRNEIALHAIVAGAVLLTMACGGPKRTTSATSNQENVDRVTLAYQAYAEGYCNAVRNGIATNGVRSWKPSEMRYAYHLLDGFCAELAAHFAQARRIYRTILQEAPLSFAADDAGERLRILRLSEIETDYARTLESARQQARTGSTRREALERERVSYPPFAHRAGISGHAIVEFKVTADGLTETPIVVDSSPPLIFDGAAIRAIRSWRYATDSNNADIDRQAIRLLFRPEDSAPAPMTDPDGSVGAPTGDG